MLEILKYYQAVLWGWNPEEYTAQVIAPPIVMQGDPIGTVILMSKDIDVNIGEIEIKLVETAAGFLSKQMES